MTELKTLLRRKLFNIIEAVLSNIPEESRIGVLSSGGIDSSTIIAILLKLGRQPQAITLGFGGDNDEIESARAVCDNLGVTHRVKVMSRILESVNVTNRALNEPYRAACYYYDALKFARDCGVEHLFDGLGVDEFYGGYGFRYERVIEYVNRGQSPVDSYVMGAHPNDYVGEEIFGNNMKNIHIDWEELFPYFRNGLPILEQIFLSDYNSKCRQNFVPLAKLSKELGFQIHYPWVADEFIDFSMIVPTNLKYDLETAETKILFRKAVEDLIPDVAIRKPKQGFGPALDRVWSELRPLAEDAILDGQLAEAGVINRNYYKVALTCESPQTLQINKCWDAFTLEDFIQQSG